MYAVSLFRPIDAYKPLWLAWVGLAWGFHVTFTIHSLMQPQTDVRQYGRLFSFTLILGMNVLLLCLWIVLITDVSIETFVAVFSERAGGHANQIRAGIFLLTGGNNPP